MNGLDTHPPLIAIVGPTASGKSTLGVWLAERFGGEIVSCDSTQLYRGLDIGTAKPTAEERRGVPHHLLDVLGMDDVATAGGYREMALQVLKDLRQRNRMPIFTVGTGMYLRALLEGLADVPQRSENLRKRLRASAQRHPDGHLHRLLRRMDASAATKIAARDEQKLIRTIEVCLLARKPVSQVYRSGRVPLEGWRSIKIGLMPERGKLYERIHARTDAMLAKGWMREVEELLAGGIKEDTKPFDFIGYRELRAVLRGETSLDEARLAIQQTTRHYAKRQITWFRREVNIQWFNGFGDDVAMQEKTAAWLTEQELRESSHGSKEAI